MSDLSTTRDAWSSAFVCRLGFFRAHGRRKYHGLLIRQWSFRFRVRIPKHPLGTAALGGARGEATPQRVGKAGPLYPDGLGRSREALLRAGPTGEGRQGRSRSDEPPGRARWAACVQAAQRALGATVVVRVPALTGAPPMRPAAAACSQAVVIPFPAAAARR
jgi:hypothetical protein